MMAAQAVQEHRLARGGNRRAPYSYPDDEQRAAPAPKTARASRYTRQDNRHQTYTTQDDDCIDLDRVRQQRNTGPIQKSRRKIPTFLYWIIGGLLIGSVLMQIGSFLIGWGTDISNTLHYGPTRTSLVSGVFGHNNDSPAHPTEVLVMNLNGTLLLEEVPAGAVPKTKTYPTSWTLVGTDAAKWPITLSISQGEHGPNVLVSGQSVMLALVNNGTDFTLSSP